jgi:hypothetical protein
MRVIRSLAAPALLLAGIAASGSASADCGHNHKAYPQGGVLCQSGFQFVCGERGAWSKTPNRCEAKPAPAAPPPQQQQQQQQSKDR